MIGVPGRSASCKLGTRPKVTLLDPMRDLGTWADSCPVACGPRDRARIPQAARLSTCAFSRFPEQEAL